LEGREKQLGPDHPETLKSVNNLGILLSDKGDNEGAEKLYRRALEGKERVLGLDHPDTLASVNSLVFLLNKKGDNEALELLRRRATLSPEAEDAVGYNLACYECLAGNLDEAKRVITKHLEAHPERKENALKDEDFAAIRDWIRKL
jgi:Flp pilus assembly protein TadD